MGDENTHASWRMVQAVRVADGYASNERLAALAVAGSVGSGLADRYSDLELDCYWYEPPTDHDRRAPIDLVGGHLESFWEFDSADEEWSEDYRLGDLGVTVSNFLVDTVERFLDAVVLRADPDPVKHMRLAAIQRCRPLVGAALVGSWRARADRYPEDLVTAMVERSLAPDVLAGWSAREAMVSRGDEVGVRALLSRVERVVLDILSAVNRVYVPHRLVKWQRDLTAKFAVRPDALTERLRSLWTTSGSEALRRAEALLNETVELAEATTRADLAQCRAALAERRQPIDPPGG